MPTLYLLRHGQAEHGSNNDKLRQLTTAGHQHIQEVANIFLDREYEIEEVLFSPAVRTRQTCDIVSRTLGISTQNQKEIPSLYNAELYDLVSAIKDVDSKIEELLLIAHNPGLEELVAHCTGEMINMFPGNVVVVASKSWRDMINGKSKLIIRH